MVVFYLSKSLQIREDFVRTLKNYTFTNIYFWSVTKFLPSSRILWIPKGGRLLGATRMGTFITISQIVEYLYFSSHIFFIFFFFFRSSIDLWFINRFSYDPTHDKSNIYVLELEEKKKSVQEYEEDYNPYEHRMVAHPTT